MDLKGKVAIITGAGGAIGRGIAKQLVTEGMKVVLADIAKSSIDKFAAELNSLGATILAVEVNVAESESVGRMVQTVMDTFGQIDVLVNNAGVVVVSPVTELKESDWDRVIDINLKGAFLCTKAVLPTMIEKKWGKIVNIASVAGKRPPGMMCAYVSSKFGIIGLTQALCQELGPHNINVNAVCPGFVPSAMWEKELSPAFAPLMGVDPSNVLELFAKANTPLQRPQTPEDVGNAVVYLCRADNVSGVSLNVDSGYAMW